MIKLSSWLKCNTLKCEEDNNVSVVYVNFILKK